MKDKVRESDSQPTPFNNVVVIDSDLNQKIAQFNTLIGWFIENNQFHKAIDSLNEIKTGAMISELVFKLAIKNKTF